jgi:tripartite-type tricarboxylate transporter receptor subunit TctC
LAWNRAVGAPDIVARLMGQWLSERLGQPFIVENRPGAGTNIGTESGELAAISLIFSFQKSGPVQTGRGGAGGRG